MTDTSGFTLLYYDELAQLKLMSEYFTVQYQHLIE